MPTLRTILDERVREADPSLYEKLDHNRLRCFSCGHCCPIPEGQPGVCKVRFNRGGKLYVPYGYTAGMQCDPIEKKPFFHAHPGALAYSFGMLGCDLHCGYCQNWVTSQALRDPNAVSPPLEAKPEQLVRDALAQRAKVLVSTYNEPLITAEWAVAIFQPARAAGLLTAFVSNGNATPQVLDYIRPHLDLYKVDLKSFDDRHYHELGGRIAPILDSIRRIHAMGLWLEIVTLLIPDFNDSDDELRRLTEFIAEISPDIPWHVTAFHADYKMTSPAQHHARRFNPRRRNRPIRRPALHLRRQPPRPRRPLGRHPLPPLPRNPNHSPRISHHRLPPNPRRPLPQLLPPNPRPLVPKIRRPTHLRPFRSAQTLPIIYNHKSLNPPSTRNAMNPRRVPHFSRVRCARSGDFHDLIALTILLLTLASCSPRDFLTHRLATDLISASDAFRTPQQFQLQTGIVSNKTYASSEYLILQQRGWISAATARCAPGMEPAPMLGRPTDSRRRRNRSRPRSRRRNRQDAASSFPSPEENW